MTGLVLGHGGQQHGGGDPPFPPSALTVTGKQRASASQPVRFYVWYRKYGTVDPQSGMLMLANRRMVGLKLCRRRTW